MTWSAPKSFRTLALASEEVVEITRAPAVLANCSDLFVSMLNLRNNNYRYKRWYKRLRTCKANMLTPPVPCVKTVSPGFKAFPSSPYNAFHAVTAAHGSVLPCLKSNVVGILTKPDSSNAPYCLRVPSIPPPSPLFRSVRFTGPAMWV